MLGVMPQPIPVSQVMLGLVLAMFWSVEHPAFLQALPLCCRQRV